MTAMQLVILNWGKKWFMVTPLTRNLDFIFIGFIFKPNKSMAADAKHEGKNNNGFVSHAKDKHTCGRTCNATSWMKNSKVVIMQTHKERTICQYQTQSWLLPHKLVCVCMNVNTCSTCMGECVWTPTGCETNTQTWCKFVCCFCFTKRLPQYIYIYIYMLC